MIENKNQSKIRQVLLVGDTTLDPLARYLERRQEPPCLRCTAAPYGQIYQVLLDRTHPVWEPKPDILVVWTAPNLTLPSVSKLLQYDFGSKGSRFDSALEQVDQFATAVLTAAKRVGLVLVPNWMLPASERWIQSLAWRHGMGISNLLSRANLMLAEKFAGQENIVLLDAGYWQASLSRSAYDPRMFAVAKILYSPSLFEKAAAEIKAVIRGSLGLTKKVVVCDLDNTLWGGVVGDDGVKNIKLGAPDPLGECFQAFQAGLKALRSRGILLAICSRNDEALALSVIEEHPAMILRKSDFVAWRINWEDKARNIREIAEELNLGLNSFVFLDDSPQERDQVRQLLPEVLTPDLPQSPSEYAPFLTSLTCFETPSLGREDIERTQMYTAERSRKEALDIGGDIERWLSSLEIKISAAPLRRDSLPRAVQLLNKTNQFNIKLRRLDEKSFWDWVETPNNFAYTFRVADRFGDFGLVGLSSISIHGVQAQISDFVMSCRVMGKKVEEALLGYTVARAKAAGADHVVVEAVEGPRNLPARKFFATKVDNGNGVSIDAQRVTVPAHIRIEDES